MGVHTTQFAIREAGLYEPVLAAAVEDSRAWTQRPLVLIAGVCGRTAQAVSEARTAVRLGYHAGLLSLAALKAKTRMRSSRIAARSRRRSRWSASICS